MWGPSGRPIPVQLKVGATSDAAAAMAAAGAPLRRVSVAYGEAEKQRDTQRGWEWSEMIRWLVAARG